MIKLVDKDVIQIEFQLDVSDSSARDIYMWFGDLARQFLLSNDDKNEMYNVCIRYVIKEFMYFRVAQLKNGELPLNDFKSIQHPAYNEEIKKYIDMAYDAVMKLYGHTSNENDYVIYHTKPQYVLMLISDLEKLCKSKSKDVRPMYWVENEAVKLPKEWYAISRISIDMLRELIRADAPYRPSTYKKDKKNSQDTKEAKLSMME